MSFIEEVSKKDELFFELEKIRNISLLIDGDLFQESLVDSSVLYINDIDVHDCTRIDLYNGEPDFLHIRGLELFNNCEKIDADRLPKYKCIAGSSYGKTKKAKSFVIGELVDPYFFHTDKKEIGDCRFSIIFTSPITFTEIRIYLRKGFENRSKSLTVDIVKSDDTVTTLYSGVSCQKEILRNSLLKCSDINLSRYFNDKQAIHLLYLFWSIDHDNSNYTKPPWLYSLHQCGAYGLDEDVIKEYINRAILFDKKVQITSYGVIKCFSCWDSSELSDYITKTKEAIEKLYNFCDYAFYAYGACLGFVREPTGFIPHDADLDIICTFTASRYHTFSDLRKEFVPFLNSSGFTIEDAWDTVYHVAYKGSHRFDIFPAIIDSRGKVAVYPESKGKYLDSKHLVPPISVNVMGLECLIPRNPFKFLETVYGNNWRTPIDIRTFS